jgi:dihydroxy-acid dehydratase
MSRRAGYPVTLDDFDAASRRIPVIANIRPSGDRYLMEDFHAAGGLRALLANIREHLRLDALTANGRTLGDNIDGAVVSNPDVIRPTNRAIYHEGALAVLRGNLAPDGVVMKPSACAPHLLQHSGRALVFDDYASLKRATDDPELDVTEHDILVLRNAGPLGAGMPEWGMLPIPVKLVRQGVRDMLRLSDARMSGTSYGGCLLHCAPEAAVGGPLALVQTGDRITVDVPARRIHLEVSDEELARRKQQWQRPAPRWQRGYGWMFSRHVLQADQGCDFDFLERDFGEPVPEPDIY